MLITGATGLFGRALVDRLLEMGVQLRTTSRRPPPPDFPLDRVEHLVGDLADQSFARRATKDMHGLFHLAGRRGSLGIQRRQAATMLGENLMICLTTSGGGTAFGRRADPLRQHGHRCIRTWRSIARSSPGRATPILRTSMRHGPSASPRNTSKTQELEYGLKNTAIIRPVNTFGPHDDFAPETALVVPALIGRALSGETPFTVWGDGSAVRDSSLRVGRRRRHAARL